jgi:hypothetical protein
MSVRKRRLIVNDNKLEVTVIRLTKQFGDWYNCVPDSILLIKKLETDEIIDVLYPDDKETIKELRDILDMSDENKWNFWQCIISVDERTEVVWITPASLLKLFVHVAEED